MRWACRTTTPPHGGGFGEPAERPAATDAHHPAPRPQLAIARRNVSRGSESLHLYEYGQVFRDLAEVSAPCRCRRQSATGARDPGDAVGAAPAAGTSRPGAVR